MLAFIIGLLPGAASLASGGWGLILAALSNQWVRLGVVGLAVYCYADIHGRSIANAACHEADVRAANAVLARDLAIRTLAADDATRRASDLDKVKAANEGIISDLRTQLDRAPAPASNGPDLRRIDGDGVKRLLSIRKARSRP